MYRDFAEHIFPNPMGNIHPRFWGWVLGTGTALGALAELLAASDDLNVMSAVVGGISAVWGELAGDEGIRVYEVLHGFAPELAGRGIANPCGTIASVAMLLRHSLGLAEEADAVEAAIASVIAEGGRTADIATANEQKLTTSEMTNAIIARLG